MASSSGQTGRFKFLRLSWLLIMGLCVCPMLELVDVARALLETEHILFVFGDSYVDNGNGDDRKYANGTFRYPNGSSGEGPSGRYSDDRVLSDFIAKGLKIAPPKPFYQLPPPLVNYTIANGLNFAKGGSGVFVSPTGAKGVDNATIQIQRFSEVAKNVSIYSEDQLRSAFTLLSMAGNDYIDYFQTHSPSDFFTLQRFIDSVVNQTVVDITKLYDLGLRKFIVVGLPAAGCLPGVTVLNNFTKCNDDINNQLPYHNNPLNSTLANLNSSLPGSSFVFLDQYKSFNKIVQNFTGFGFDNNLEPCCSFNCGELDGDGNANFTLCSEPKKRFFWDAIHLTDAAWDEVSALYFKGQDFTFPGPNLAAFIGA